MIGKLIILFTIITLCSCASIEYKSPEGAKMSYMRIGDQHIKGLKIDKNEQGSTVSLVGQDASDEALREAIQTLRETMQAVDSASQAVNSLAR